jgi:hypothetical protein
MNLLFTIPDTSSTSFDLSSGIVELRSIPSATSSSGGEIAGGCKSSIEKLGR